MNYRKLLLPCDEYSMEGQIFLFESDVVMELMEFAQETIRAALTWPITVITLCISSDSCNTKCCVREVICVVLYSLRHKLLEIFLSFTMSRTYSVEHYCSQTLFTCYRIKHIYVLSLGYGNITLFTIVFCQRRVFYGKRHVT